MNSRSYESSSRMKKQSTPKRREHNAGVIAKHARTISVNHPSTGPLCPRKGVLDFEMSRGIARLYKQIAAVLASYVLPPCANIMYFRRRAHKGDVVFRVVFSSATTSWPIADLTWRSFRNLSAIGIATADVTFREHMIRG